MQIRTRKLIGTVALLVLVVVWALLAMGFAHRYIGADAETAGVPRSLE